MEERGDDQGYGCAEGVMDGDTGTGASRCLVDSYSLVNLPSSSSVTSMTPTTHQ